jgi:hypothetical protein
MTRARLEPLPADASGRVLDRLAGLEQVIPPEQFRQAVQMAGCVDAPNCVLTHDIMLHLVLAMGLLTDLSIRQVFKRSRFGRAQETTPPRSTLCEARQRLGLEPVQHLFGQVVGPLATPQTPGAFYQGFRLMGCDGTIFDVPDSDANAAAFHRACGGRGDGAFPQVRKVSLVEIGTHVETALALGGWQDSEQVLVQRLFDQLPADALLLEDRGFFSYDAWKKLLTRSVQLLVRVKTNLVLKPIRRLSDGSYLAKIYQNSYDRQKDRGGIVVRVIDYRLDDPQRVGHGDVHRLLTTLLDETRYPARELILLYHERWEEELVFDEQKTHQDPRRVTKPANLRSGTPVGVKQEVYALSLAHFVVRSLMLAAASEVGLDTDRLSFLGCLQILETRLPEYREQTTATWAGWYRSLLWEMSQEVIEPRRNRANPRVIKRKMSKWKKKRPEHRRIPPLKKRFAETVVMTN